MMPGTDGLDLAVMIRKSQWPGETKLVLSSSSGMITSISKARELGFDATLPKPLRPGALIECVNQLFKYADNGLTDQPAPEPRGSAKNQASQRVLVAEDNHVNQKLVVVMLKAQGYSVDVAANGLEAVDAVRRIPYELVLMDVQMPEMDGIEAARKIRQMGGEIGDIPIIGVTAHALKGDRERVIQAGMNDYLTKPINKQALLNKVAFWTSQDSPGWPKEEAEAGGMEQAS
jgi:CheY-like chemotaxis protein